MRRVRLTDGEELVLNDELVVRAGGRVSYSDTDSIITDVELPSSKELGHLKDEYPGDTLSYRAIQPKVYLIEREGLSKVTMKGFPLVLRRRETLERLEHGEVIRTVPKPNGTGEERWKRLEKIRTLARKGFRGPPEMNPVEKSFRTKYDKRTATTAGGTKALVLDEPIGGSNDE